VNILSVQVPALRLGDDLLLKTELDTLWIILGAVIVSLSAAPLGLVLRLS
jgi:hypothetical protein